MNNVPNWFLISSVNSIVYFAEVELPNEPFGILITFDFKSLIFIEFPSAFITEFVSPSLTTKPDMAIFGLFSVKLLLSNNDFIFNLSDLDINCNSSDVIISSAAYELVLNFQPVNSVIS